MHSLYSNPTLPPCGRLTIVNRRHQVHVALEWLTKEWKTGSFKVRSSLGGWIAPAVVIVPRIATVVS